MNVELIYLDRAPAPKLVGGHVHTCPECHDHVECSHTCSCEPDMDLDDGTPRGAYVVCCSCAAPVAPVIAVTATTCVRAHRDGVDWNRHPDWPVWWHWLPRQRGIS